MGPAVSFDVNSTLGAVEIGVLVSYVLFGVTTTQTYIYYSRFPDDSRKLKALVAFVWYGGLLVECNRAPERRFGIRFCEFGHALCIGHALYVYTIFDYAHPERILGTPPISFTVGIVFSGVIGASVQAFFSFRIYGLSKTLYIPILTWGMSFVRLVLSAVIFFEALGVAAVDVSEVKWQWLLTATWSISAANDLTVTATLVVLLYRERRNAHTRTGPLVDKLILWTIETGMLTSSASVVMLACYVTMKNNYNFIWAGVFNVLPRLFSNSLLASLNSRTTLRAMNEVPLPSLHFTSEIACDETTHGESNKAATENI
ncbi:hypothetical protein B0H13DRAFT_2360378 [Mycena leptocephala]|nr:hypothetical protein B0H13DRAFT_2360378 [Mycena leptocephala]